jgi:histidinol-phosphate phosphatase family protein
VIEPPAGPPADAGPSVTIVVPTVGRPSLLVLLESIAASAAHTGLPAPPIVLVDDRRLTRPLADSIPASLRVQVLLSGGRGPAAARNVGWRAAATDWIAFVDDDVVVHQQWLSDLAQDLRSVDGDAQVAGSTGVISVPLPADRRPTDWERGTAGLATASYITADMSYRRAVLVATGGFDERFPRAFREDSDLALRVLDRGHRLVRGTRRTEHPVRPSTWWASLAQQRGNADDVLMRRLHGAGWRQRARAPLGRLPRHLITTVAGATAIVALAARKRPLATVAAAGCVSLTAEFAWLRIAPGPRTRTEILRMVTTSAAIPPAASWFWLRASTRRTPAPVRLPAAVLLDRDGTIVHDVPYNGDPELVRPLPGVHAALDRLRAAGIPIAVISNQSGIGRGLLTRDSVDAVNARVEQLLGPFEGWFVCPHTEDDGCACRKPAPGLVHRAAASLGVPARDCVVIGDIGSDVNAAEAAGAVGILVPTAQTLPQEISAASVRAATFEAAVDIVLAGRS